VTQLQLFARCEGSGPPLVILHGLFGSSRNWASQSRRLAATWQVCALDLRNHGDSPWAEDMSYPAMADDILAYLDRAGFSQAVILGHSMGGKAAMAAALTAPERVRALVVVDMAPVRYASGMERYVDAMQAVELRGVTRRADVDRAMSEAVPERALRAFLLQNLVAEKPIFRWRLNLDVLGRSMAEIVDFPKDFPAKRYDGPAAFIYGEASPYVGPDRAPEIERLFPAADLLSVAGAGHWVHAEAPEAFMVALESFLDRL
jgi:pimeloyl-ACP methyl ester carboxylesterase